MAASGTTCATLAASGNQGLVHDLPNAVRAAATLGVAAKATIDLIGRAWRGVTIGDSFAHVMVGQYVAGTDDHGMAA